MYIWLFRRIPIPTSLNTFRWTSLRLFRFFRLHFKSLLQQFKGFSVKSENLITDLKILLFSNVS